MIFLISLFSQEPEGLKNNRVGCDEENTTTSVVAIYDGNDPRLRLACKGGVVNVTVEDDEKRGIREALRKGFLLNWTASNCVACTRSGGRCGFDLNPDIFGFRCYCPDRVHSAVCVPDLNHDIFDCAIALIGFILRYVFQLLGDVEVATTATFRGLQDGVSHRQPTRPRSAAMRAWKGEIGGKVERESGGRVGAGRGLKKRKVLLFQSGARGPSITRDPLSSLAVCSVIRLPIKDLPLIA
ncbi:hypothetical protein RIF29_16390 [Crotalaria pallida]|uniref:Wall-associated receptor kinase C-terminal domain-containing protein n=1 Tax=Crotalaria pallida TaxID=3830 RepID=A0AAN9FF55_CROPI